jgi:excisionase family DNA binding protein
VSTHTPPKKAVRRLESIQHAAEYAGVSVKTIRRRIADGGLTGYRMGPRLIRVDLNEVDMMLRPIPTAGGGNDAA